MRMKENTKLIGVLFFIIISVFISAAFQSINLLTVTLGIFIAFVVLIFIRDLSGNITILFFIVSLFTFIVFRPLYDLINNTGYQYGEEIYFTTLILVIISLFGLVIGYMVSSTKLKIFNFKFKENNKWLSNSALTLVIITAPFTIISVAQRFQITNSSGYVDMYAANTSIFDIIGNYNLAFIYIYLATSPSKKQLEKTLFLLIPLLISDIFTGRRGNAIVNVMVLITYLILRKKYIDKKHVKLNIKNVTVGIIILISIVFLSMYISQIRINEYTLLNDNIIIEFFKQQSSIFDFIQSTLYFGNELSPISDLFSLQAIYNGTFINRLIAEFFLPISNNVQIFENNLGRALVYFRDPIYFAAGGGFGNSYIVELFFDFSYGGVLFYNVFLGWIFKKTESINFNNWILVSYFLMILKSLYFLPRESTFNWLNQIVSTTNVLSIITVWLVAKFIERIYN